MKEQLRAFKSNLEDFMAKHKKNINKDPRLKHEFHAMCRELGIDPLVCKLYSASRGYWAGLVPDIQGYYELGVQIVTVCMALRERTGGLLEVNDCIKWVKKLRGSRAGEINEEDVYKAIESLSVLGRGLQIISTGPQCKVILSVPIELDTDHQLVIAKGRETGYVTARSMSGWPTYRFEKAIVSYKLDSINIRRYGMGGRPGPRDRILVPCPQSDGSIIALIEYHK